MVIVVPDYAAMSTADLPKSYQPQQLKVAASHKAQATPVVAGRLVGYLFPAVTMFAVGLDTVAGVAGAAKLTQ